MVAMTKCCGTLGIHSVGMRNRNEQTHRRTLDINCVFLLFSLPCILSVQRWISCTAENLSKVEVPSATTFNSFIVCISVLFCLFLIHTHTLYTDSNTPGCALHAALKSGIGWANGDRIDDADDITVCDNGRQAAAAVRRQASQHRTASLHDCCAVCATTTIVNLSDF